MKKPKTALQMDLVWQYLMGMAREDKVGCKRIAKAFNHMLDELLGEDFFGTEGQCDPRGDRRE